MKKLDLKRLADTYGVPVLIIALGGILLLHPDSAVVLITKLLGWVLVLWAGGCAANGFLGPRQTRSARLFCAVGLLAAGIWLMNNPLLLAKLLGRVLGAFLLFHGMMGVKNQTKNQKVSLSFGLLLSGGTALMGLVLLLLPMATSRLLFSLIGLVMIAIGAGDLYDRLNRREPLEAGDPNIIDVEKL